MSDTIHVLWVRHCESCSNVAFKKVKKILTNLKEEIYNGAFNEPLCTEKGFNQSLSMGSQINDWYNNEYIKKYKSNKKIQLYSSYLPRALETSKLISSKIDIEHLSKYIIPLCHISEFPLIYDSLFKNIPTQNKSIYYNFLCYIEALNNLFKNYGSEIKLKENINCDNELHNNKCCICNKDGVCLYSNDKSYNIFKNIYLGNVIKPKKLNIIVSHGKYIGKFLKLKSHPKNTQAYLIKYKKIKNKKTNNFEWIEEEISDDIFSIKPDENNINKLIEKNKNIHNNNKNLDNISKCKYKFKTTIINNCPNTAKKYSNKFKKN